MSEDAGTAPPRERGWWGPILGLLVLTMLASRSASRIVVPIGDIMLLLAPVTAACAVAGWRAGGRLPLAVLWSVFAGWVVWRSGPSELFIGMAREWAVLVALAFGVVASRGEESFLPKALLALAAASLVGGLVLLLAPGGLDGALELVRGEVARRALLATREWRELTGSADWAELVQQSPGWGTMAEGVEAQMAQLPAVALRFFPALLALQSLATMALGWAVYHRVGRVRLGPPLARLQDLRFHDALVWGVVVGLTLVALPLRGWARDAGFNLLVFFGALYAIRGMGVVLWFLTPGRAMTGVLVLIVLLWPRVLMVAAGLGLGDTWFDWRRVTRQRSQRSE